jgi:hypothetical protein
MSQGRRPLAVVAVLKSIGAIGNADPGRDVRRNSPQSPKSSTELTQINLADANGPYFFRFRSNLRRETVNALEKLKALDEQREKVQEEARTAALQKARDAIRELGELGLNYSLV